MFIRFFKSNSIMLLTQLILISLLLISCSHTSKDFSSTLISKELIIKADKLDRGHPLEFFKTAGEYFRDGKINDSAFMFYLGQLRYRYYISVNPPEKMEGDIMTFSSMQSVLGSELNYKLGKDIDSYLQILDAVLEWGNRFDSKFCSRKINPEKYRENIDGLIQLKEYVIDNRDLIEEEHKETE